MGLSWNWLQLFFNSVVNNLGRIDYLCSTRFNIITKNSEEFIDDLTENHLNTIRVELVVSNYIVVTLEALCENTSTTTGRTHSRYENNVLNLHVFLSESVIPSFVIHPLTKQLNRRLSAVFFFLWHI